VNQRLPLYINILAQAIKETNYIMERNRTLNLK